MRLLHTLADRTAVLFLGVAAGVAIGYAFGSSGGGSPVARPVAPTIAPPPPVANAGPGARPGPASAGPAATLPPERAQPFQPHLLGSIAEGRKVRIGVFGDSYGDGIWSALYRLLPAKAGYEVVKFSQQSTGFTRYASLNLEEHAREQLSGDPVDVAVISFGANDTQGVLVGNHAAALLSPEWQEVVGKRVDGFVRELRAQGAVVYWVGLPKMRKPQFDADIAGMNTFYAQRMKALGVPWIETASLTVDENGAFAPYLPDGPDGERTLIRANDGIHMSMTGYVRITRALAQRIGAYVAAARTTAGVAAPAPLAGPAPVRPGSGAAPDPSTLSTANGAATPARPTGPSPDAAAAPRRATGVARDAVAVSKRPTTSLPSAPAASVRPAAPPSVAPARPAGATGSSDDGAPARPAALSKFLATRPAGAKPAPDTRPSRAAPPGKDGPGSDQPVGDGPVGDRPVTERPVRERRADPAPDTP